MPRTYNNVVFADELEPILQRSKALVQTCFARALRDLTASGGSQLAPDSVEGIVAAYLKKQTDRQRVGVRLRPDLALRASATTTALRRLRMAPTLYGPLADLNMDADASISAQISSNGRHLFSDTVAALKSGKPSVVSDPLVALLKRNEGRLLQDRNLHGLLVRGSALATEDTTTPAQSPPPRPWKSVELVITKMKCLDPVDEWGIDWGTDYIRMGGKLFAGGTNDFRKTLEKNQFDIGEFTSQSVVHKDHSFGRIDLTSAPDGVLTFGAFLGLAEKDADGGFLEFLRKLWDAIDGTVVKAITDVLVGAIVGAGFGGTLGVVVAPADLGLTMLVGSIVGATVGFIVASVMEALKDDVFDVLTIEPEFIGSKTSLFGNGKSTSKIYEDEFVREGARYRVWYKYVLT